MKDRTKPAFDDSQALEGNAPGFSIPLTVKRAKPGETVVFECLPYGKPFPQIKWLKDGIELVPSEKIKIEALDDHTQRLTIDDVDILSSGYFRCVATNEFGTASTKAELTITGGYRRLQPETKKQKSLFFGGLKTTKMRSIKNKKKHRKSKKVLRF